MSEDKIQSLADILKNKSRLKPPAHPWQELALTIIKELGVPGFKRSSIFKVCKEKPAHQVMMALNDTKELCKTGSKWQYFFKVIDNENKK
ncbi:MAG: hypothetical protein WC146_02585 [Patescibacteria group bacterium]|jgi:hypothetical protein